ncbi:hypothetical protein AB0L82_22120 [Nocardia sp. NPDC052001]|uniref:hypothetical protein n=1 Tax=Nocardia sp. NPDC052001 TaxID=3154853 RepID=UPI00344A7B3B
MNESATLHRTTVVLGLLSPVGIVLGLLMLVACGEHSDDVRDIAPSASLVSAPATSIAPSCIMFCDAPPSWSMTMPAPSATENSCPPFCDFEKW